MRRIKICDDICFDLLRLLAPAKVGLELATVSDRFDALVDTHFMSRKWALGKLRIDRPFKGAKEIVIVKINIDGSEETLPIPQTPLPNYIIGFEAIYFGCCVDNNVIGFLRHIGPLFKSDIFLALDISVVTSPFFATSVWPLFNLSGISKMLFEYSNVFQQFRRRTSPCILSDCANLRFINYDTDGLLHFSPNDSDGSSDDQALSKWLHTPRSDGRPKVIKSSGDGQSLRGLKKIFQNATTSASFIILMLMLDSVRPFEMDSLWTRERMTLRGIEHCGWRGWALIERSPIGKNVHQWDEWVREALDDGESRKWKVIATCDNPTL